MRRSDVVVLGVIGAVAQLAGFVVRAWGLYVVSVASELRRRVNGADIQGIIEAVPVGRVPATLAWAEHERPSFPRQLTRSLEPITAPPRGHITVDMVTLHYTPPSGIRSAITNPDSVCATGFTIPCCPVVLSTTLRISCACRFASSGSNHTRLSPAGV